MAKQQPTLMQWLRPVEKPEPAPVDEPVLPKKRPCSKRLKNSFHEHLAGGSQRVSPSRTHLFDRFEQVTTRSLAVTQWGTAEADTSTGLELRGVSSIEFDKQGELFVASSGNRVHLLNAEDEFLSAYWSSSTPQSLLALSTHEYVRRVHWNHVDVDVIGCLGATPQIRLYNLALASTAPIEVLSDRGDTRTVLSDFAIDRESGKTVAAVGRNGKVAIWDRRASQSQPRCVLAGPRSAQDLLCAALSPDGRVLYAGGRNARVVSWDLRAGKQAAIGAPMTARMLANSAPPLPRTAESKKMTIPVLHLFAIDQLVASFESRAAPENRPPLSRSLPQTSVQHLSFDPRDPSRLAVQLGCGWLGVLDVDELSITHLHCPEPAAEGTALQSGVRRLAAWMPAWGVVASASDSAADVSFVDVTSKRGRWAGAGQQAEQRAPSCRISSQGVSVACHPHSDHVVVGTEDDCVVVLSPWPSAEPQEEAQQEGRDAKAMRLAGEEEDER